ncbi:Uncharacterised protein [Salmonella enterica]|nr:Uncharacterised protein [Salmonella enterica]
MAPVTAVSHLSLHFRQGTVPSGQLLFQVRHHAIPVSQLLFHLRQSAVPTGQLYVQVRHLLLHLRQGRGGLVYLFQFQRQGVHLRLQRLYLRQQDGRQGRSAR